jgi:LacI family transcriptional regulator
MKRFFSGFSVGREYGSKVISAMRSKGITAVLSHNYQYAQGIIQKLLENKIKVPEDISVLCFGDFESNKYFKIPLTAINVPVFEMVDAIICRMEAEKFDLSLVNIDSELKIRESTGPVRK